MTHWCPHIRGGRKRPYSQSKSIRRQSRCGKSDRAFPGSDRGCADNERFGLCNLTTPSPDLLMILVSLPLTSSPIKHVTSPFIFIMVLTVYQVDGEDLCAFRPDPTLDYPKPRGQMKESCKECLCPQSAELRIRSLKRRESADVGTACGSGSNCGSGFCGLWKVACGRLAKVCCDGVEDTSILEIFKRWAFRA